jgi:hypothetical protein
MSETRPSDFDWVTARNQCSLGKVFEFLYLETKKNTETMNQINGQEQRQWQLVEFQGGFSVSRRTVESTMGARFTIRDNAVVVDGIGVDVGFKAGLTLNDDGKCRLLVDGKELDRWQVLRRALEPLFFHMDPF